uniref:DUF4220 domain-containing protein n=1 Tax=Oryza punctata TaxID=4537 RepID=A0A0E0JI50_ORYPU
MSKLYAYKKARHSFEVGRNPRLIAGYTEQLNSQRGDEHVIPLLLMGEDKQEVEEGPRGYRFTDDSGFSSLVTMDNVVNMASTNDTVLNSWPPYVDLCFSFSLFKLLRQRFTGRSVVEADNPPVPSFMTKLQHGDPQGVPSHEDIDSLHVAVKMQEVNTAILAKFRDSNWSLPTVTASLQQISIGNILLYGNGKGTSDVILVWHIATCIFEIKHPHKPSNAPAVTATRLSRYCAYLLSSAPELLPDDKAWSEKLYKSVKKITEPIFRKSNKRPMNYEDILQKLEESRQKKNLEEKSNSNTELENGVALGKKLVNETRGAEQEGWEILAGFWSAMVLYIAPSDNLGAHREAIARGGELITILWTMLTHAGIISRPRIGHAV